MAQVADPKPETETKAADEKADFELENLLADADATNDVKTNEPRDKGNHTDVHLDELSSLEQEIAKMHNTQLGEAEPERTLSEEATADTTSASGMDLASCDTKVTIDEQIPTHRGTPLSHQLEKWSVQNSPGERRSESTLEEVDLIALLKGTDTNLEHCPKEESNPIELALAEMDVGVTIEGEGQYEIIEIDDDDNAHMAKVTNVTATSNVKLSSKAKSTANKSGASSYGGKTKLSPEQARAVALEQMAHLSSQKAARRKEQSNAVVLVKSQDIVSSLNDDWNEYDSGSSDTTSQVTIKKPPAATLPKKANHDLEGRALISNVKVVVKSITQKQLPATTAKDKIKAKATPSRTPTPTITDATTAANTEAPTGFKRVIKRKIIWDPDAPETQKSFAQYASSTKSSVSPLPSTTTQIASGTGSKGTNVTSKLTVNLRKEPQETSVGKKPRAATPKETNKSPTKRAATPNTNVTDTSQQSIPTTKRRSQTPGAVSGVINGTVKKKKVSEIDRLMGDEGAANMVQAVEHEQRELSGGEISNKPLMRKRALTITGRAAAEAQGQTVVPKKDSTHGNQTKSTRRGATPATASAGATTAAAMESVFTNVATVKSRASDSWDYVYKQRASEESMIVRRRSNSSYSSNASVSRLSLDNKAGVVLSDDAADNNDPSFKFLKPENKANTQKTTGVGTTAHTLANDLKRSTSAHCKEAAKTDLVVFNKLDKVAQLIINTHHSKTGQTYNAQLLHKLSETLNKLAKSNEYNTVLISVQGQQFCQGIDCQELVAGALEKRKSCASQLATVIKTYLRTLATFPKPLVAGIIGNLKNLGVMQLPLFDYVVSADDCSFETNYSKIGQLPEGYALWHKHEKVSSQTHARLFLLGDRLDTSDLLTPNSFINKSCNSRNVNEEALAIAKLISTSSAETYRTLKRLNHTVTNTANLSRLEEEFKIITEQWSTANCQANFKRYLSDVNF